MTRKPTSYEDAVALLDSFRKLEENWDSYGSRIISVRAIEAAKVHLKRMIVTNKMAMPWIYPMSNGGVNFEWEGNNQFVELEITPDENFEIYHNVGQEIF